MEEHRYNKQLKIRGISYIINEKTVEKFVLSLSPLKLPDLIHA